MIWVGEEGEGGGMGGRRGEGWVGVLMGLWGERLLFLKTELLQKKSQDKGG